MQSPNRILVPVDFSDPSLAALRYATALGAQLGASVDVLHVWDPPRDVESRTKLLVEFAKSDEGHKMMEWLSSFEQDSQVETRGRIAPGGEVGVTDAILREVECGDYDLVVMGAHPHHGFWRLLKGGVTDEVVRRAPCPVLTIRAEDFPPPDWTDFEEADGAVPAGPV